MYTTLETNLFHVNITNFDVKQMVEKFNHLAKTNLTKEKTEQGLEVFKNIKGVSEKFVVDILEEEIHYFNSYILDLWLDGYDTENEEAQLEERKNELEMLKEKDVLPKEKVLDLIFEAIYSANLRYKLF